MMTTTPTDTEILQKAANEARGLAMDAVAACKSGHLGLPLGAAEIGAVLFSNIMSFNAEDPNWLNRDRFVLSAGHGSMFLYGWLHLAGYEVSLQDLKDFRKLHSKTPGHPESFMTPGVECTTGPLGQGVANAVGMAVAAKLCGERYNNPNHKLFTHHTFALCGDGCLQEGVANEAASFAGRFGLDNLTLIYDSNDVTLDAPADKTQAEDTAARFESYGFNVTTIDGHDFKAIHEALEASKKLKNGKPTLIVAKTEIGRGIPEVAGTAKAHGESGAAFVAEAKKGLGLPAEDFYVSDEVRAHFKEIQRDREQLYKAWQSTYADWKGSNPELAQELEDARGYKVPHNLLSKIPQFDADAKLATRAAGGTVLNAIAPHMPLLNSGSADLHGSTKNYIKDVGDFDKHTPSGRNFYYGIREHAMGAIVNGMGYYGLVRPSGATFLTFSDYMRPAIRLAALSKLPIFHIFTHDSPAVGEDGPTHQPVETTASLRLIPGLDVIRPADPEETAAAYVAALNRTTGPTALILSRQGLPNLSMIDVRTRREGTLKGGYIARKEAGELEGIIIATGSELHLALEAAERLGDGVRVVSMPCCEIFDRQPAEYREEVLPSACVKRVSIEAGVTSGWHQYVGSAGKTVGIDTFGLSAPGATVLDQLGINVEAIVQAFEEV